MAKLYGGSSAVDVPYRADEPPVPMVSTEVLFGQLDNHLKAYESVQDLFNQVAGESLTLVDTKNVVLFNAYISLLERNFGIAPSSVNPAALESRNPISVNAEVSLEGWMGDIWKKIKGFFNKIFDSIKEFMKKHFTRLGRLKNQLKNLIDVAKETDKDLKTARLDKVPGGLASKLKGFNEVSEANVSEVTKTAVDIVAQIKTISDLTIATAKSGLVDASFITDIKKLRDVALAANKQIDANTQEKKGLGIIKDRARRSEINSDNKSLAETAKNARNAADDADSDLVSAGNAGDGSDGDLERKAQQAFKVYCDKLVASLETFKGKKLVGGRTMTKIEITEDNQLNVEFEDNGEAPTGVNLTNKEGIVSLCQAAYNLIEAAEKQSDIYAKTNDEIMKQLQTVDTLIIDIDRVDPQRYGKYRRVIDQRIRARLNMVKTVFRSYNQVNKNFFETVLSTGDAVVEYSVLSLKHF